MLENEIKKLTAAIEKLTLQLESKPEIVPTESPEKVEIKLAKPKEDEDAHYSDDDHHNSVLGTLHTEAKQLAQQLIKAGKLSRPDAKKLILDTGADTIVKLDMKQANSLMEKLRELSL